MHPASPPASPGGARLLLSERIPTFTEHQNEGGGGEREEGGRRKDAWG